MSARTLLFALVLIVALTAPAAAQTVVTPPVVGPVTQPFDPPDSPYGPGHRGVDVAAGPGDEVRAAIGGVVTFAGRVAGVGWVTVEHSAGLETTYGALDRIIVRRGQRVVAGAVLGRLAADADHVDWGARLDGTYVDPLSLLARWDVVLVHPDDPIPLLPPGLLGAGSAALPGGRLLVPVAGPVTSGFGIRTHPIIDTTRLHAGLDFGAASGTPVRAAAAGVVTQAGTAGGYGTLVSIEHAGGLETRYAHLSSAAVHAGEQVRAGAMVGRVGSTGLATGPHLHFEVRAGGVAQDPAKWLGA